MLRRLILTAVAALLANFMVACDENPFAPSEAGEGSHVESGSE